MDIRHKLKEENEDIYNAIAKRIEKEDPNVMPALKERDKILKEYTSQIEPLKEKLKSTNDKLLAEFNSEKAKLTKKFESIDEEEEKFINKKYGEDHKDMVKIKELSQKISSYQKNMEKEISKVSGKNIEKKIEKIKATYESKIENTGFEIRALQQQFTSAIQSERDKFKAQKEALEDKFNEEFSGHKYKKVISELTETIKGLQTEMNSEILSINTNNNLERIDVYFQEMGSKLKNQFNKNGKVGPISNLDTIDHVYNVHNSKKFGGVDLDRMTEEEKRIVEIMAKPKDQLTNEENKILKKALEKGVEAIQNSPRTTPRPIVDASPRSDSISSTPPLRPKTLPPEAPTVDPASSSPAAASPSIRHSRRLSESTGSSSNLVNKVSQEPEKPSSSVPISQGGGLLQALQAAEHNKKASSTELSSSSSEISQTQTKEAPSSSVSRPTTPKGASPKSLFDEIREKKELNKTPEIEKKKIESSHPLAKDLLKIRKDIEGQDNEKEEDWDKPLSPRK